MAAFERISAGAALSLLLCGGCAPPAPGDDLLGEAASPQTVANGLHLNGPHLNGLHLNGVHLNGLHLNGARLDGSSLNGSYLNNVPAAAVPNLASAAVPNVAAASASPDLAAALTNGLPLGALDLVGVQLTASTAEGTPVVLRVDAVTRVAQSDVSLYTVSYQVPGSGSFQPLCGTQDGAPVKAIPLSGTWDESEGTETGGSHVDDPTVFTFACQGFALAKCVELGYAPWRSATECRGPGDCHPLPLAALHQACTRMLRADYCGDGTSTTRDGTLVDIWDPIPLQTDDAPTWTFEAEWTTGGAACATATRWPTLQGEAVTVADYIQHHCPARWQAPGCGGPGSTFLTANGFSLPPAQRALLRTRIQPAP